jgi:hypothetical protein
MPRTRTPVSLSALCATSPSRPNLSGMAISAAPATDNGCRAYTKLQQRTEPMAMQGLSTRPRTNMARRAHPTSGSWPIPTRTWPIKRTRHRAGSVPRPTVCRQSYLSSTQGQHLQRRIAVTSSQSPQPHPWAAEPRAPQPSALRCRYRHAPRHRAAVEHQWSRPPRHRRLAGHR